MIGAIIKKHRLKKNLSQESLCKGICAISYLSKIESGQVQANDEIIHLLLENLGIKLPENVLSPSYFQTKINSFLQADYFSRFDEAYVSYDALKPYSSYLSNSTFAIDWHRISARLAYLKKDFKTFKEQVGILSYYKAYFNTDQVQYYHYLLGLDAFLKKNFDLALDYFHLANNLIQNNVIVLEIIKTEYHKGNYVNVIRLGDENYRLLTEEGNVHSAIFSTQILAASYSNIKEINRTIELYQRLLNMGRYLNEDKMIYDVYYNIGATYLTHKSYNKALDHLKLAENYQDQSNDWLYLLLYQKLVLSYIGLKDFKSARSHLACIRQRLKTADIQKNSALYLSLEWLFFFEKSESPYHDPLYLRAIKKTFQAAEEDLHYGFKLFYSLYLIQALKAQRFYKEALEIQEKFS